METVVAILLFCGVSILVSLVCAILGEAVPGAQLVLGIASSALDVLPLVRRLRQPRPTPDWREEMLSTPRFTVEDPPSPRPP